MKQNESRCLPIGMSLLIFVFSLWNATARGGIENRGLQLLGENEPFTANTGVAMRGSSGAVYYNPAALADLDGSRMSVTGATYVSTHLNADAFAHVDGTDLPLRASAFDAIPDMAASLTKRGDWILGFSVLVPESIHLDNRVSWTTPNTQETIIQNQNIGDLWVALSAAREINEDWYVGFSLFGVQHKQTRLISVVATFPALPNIAAISTQQLDVSVYGLSLTAGALYSPSDLFDFGVRLQSPLVRLSGSGGGYSFSQLPDNTGKLTVTQRSNDAIAASYELPLDLTLGAAFHPVQFLNLLLDLSLQTGVSYDPYPSSDFSNTLSTKGTVRVNFGLESAVSDEITLRAGAFYNPSAYPSLDPAKQTEPVEDYYGVAAGVGFSSGRIVSQDGAFYSWSKGNLLQAGNTTVTTPFSTTRLGALLAFTYLL